VCEELPEVACAFVYVRHGQGTSAQLAGSGGEQLPAPPCLDVALARAPIAAMSEASADGDEPGLHVLALETDASPPEGLLVVGARGHLDAATAEAVQIAAATLGAHLALLRRLAAERDRVANLTVALETNRRIGAALGIIMAQRKVTDDQAFDLLRTVSQRRHVKLRELADEVVLTGELPEPPPGRPRHPVAHP
jgi:hypothetical protein